LSGRERNHSLDIIRGVAIFGLIWVHSQGPVATVAVDKVSSWAEVVLADGKFWTMFSILFGVSLAMQLGLAESRGEKFAARWLRRMAALFAIGCANALLFWPDDILRQYAMVGVVLLLFRKAPLRLVLGAAIVFWMLGVNDQNPSTLVGRAIGRSDAELLEQRQQAQSRIGVSLGRLQLAMRKGTYGETVRARATYMTESYAARSSGLAGPLNLIGSVYLSTFLFGLYAGRRRLLAEVGANARLLRSIALTGLFIGLPLSILARGVAWTPAWLATHIGGTGTDIRGVFFETSRLLLACGYVFGLVLLLARQEWRSRLRWLAAVGRMGLTNYVMQGAFLSTLRLGYGFGLRGRFGSLAWTLIAMGFFVVQIAFSNWWLSRFEYGPLEWLWRRLTYGRVERLPLRVRVAPA